MEVALFLTMLRGGDFSTHMDGYEEAHNINGDDIVLPLTGKGIERHTSVSPWNTLWKNAASERRILLLSFVTLILTSLVQLCIPLTAGLIIDKALNPQSFESSSVSTLLLVLFGIMSVAALLTYMRTMWQVKAGHRIVTTLREQLYSSILSQDAAYFDQHRSGDILVQLSSDAQVVHNAFQDQLLGLSRGIIMGGGAASLLLVTSPSLAAVALLILPPTMVLARAVGTRMRKRHTQVLQLQANATALAEQALTCIHTVQQFVAEPYEFRQYSKALQQAQREGVGAARLQALSSGMIQLFTNGAMLCVLGYGGSLVASGQLSPGNLTRFVMYALIMAGNVSGLSTTYLDLMKAAAALNRIVDTINLTPSLIQDSHSTRWIRNEEYSGDPRQAAVRAVSVDFNNVSFSYPTRPKAPVLHNMNLSLPAGKVVALVGASGAGKSTTTALLTRLYDVSGGQIIFDGVQVLQMKPRELRAKVGIVMQEPMLFPTSIADNIRYGKLTATDEEVRMAARLSHVLDFSDTFPDGLQTVVGARGTQLSGGQKQRVAVARCILKNPAVVVFDEATSALDAESEHLVQRAIDTACKGRTVLMIAHRMSTIRNADQIAVLQAGTIVETGSFDQLVAKPRGAFRQLMERQLVQ